MAQSVRPLKEGAARDLFLAWFPLWISWLAMALEFPVIAGCVARLSEPQLALAAFGGVIVPISFIIESPIIMLLSASTALCQDRDSYRKLFRIMMCMGGALTLLHLAVSLTSLYDLIVVRLLEIPLIVAETARGPLLLMLPWTWAIAYRRFHQGILIRFGKSSAVGMGTLLRLTVITSIGSTALLHPEIPGAIVASAALASGVVAESLCIGLLTRPVIREYLAAREPVGEPLTYRGFLTFYYPLLLTSFLDFSVQPICSAALARMPNAIESLAALPIIQGVSFVLRSPSFAISELVIARVREPGGAYLLWRGATLLAILCFSVALAMVGTPLSDLVFHHLLGLDSQLARFALVGLTTMTPLMLTASYKSYFQGSLVAYRQTIFVTAGTVSYLTTLIAGLIYGVYAEQFSGIAVMGSSLSMAAIVQLLVLWIGTQNASRSRELTPP